MNFEDRLRKVAGEIIETWNNNQEYYDKGLAFQHLLEEMAKAKEPEQPEPDYKLGGRQMTYEKHIQDTARDILRNYINKDEHGHYIERLDYTIVPLLTALATVPYDIDKKPYDIKKIAEETLEEKRTYHDKGLTALHLIETFLKALATEPEQQEQYGLSNNDYDEILQEPEHHKQITEQQARDMLYITYKNGCGFFESIEILKQAGYIRSE